jgi:hypothetical protein
MKKPRRDTMPCCCYHSQITGMAIMQCLDCKREADVPDWRIRGAAFYRPFVKGLVSP